MVTEDNSKGAVSPEVIEVDAYRHPEDEQTRRNSVGHSVIILNDGHNPVTHGLHRPYVRSAPQYIPGHGVRKYKRALSNLIPIRKKCRQRNMIGVDSAGFLSFISFSWMTKYMFKAYKTGLSAEDIPEHSPLDSCDLNAQRLELLWQEEVSRRGPKRASFRRVVWRFVRTRIIMSIIVFSISLTLGFVGLTIFMRELLQYAENENGDIFMGVIWAVCLTLAEFLRVLFFSWNWALNYRTAIRLRSACLAMLYRKVIRLNGLGEKSTGELINMFSSDGQRIFDMVLFGPMIIAGPIVTVLGVFYIYWLLGHWALLGIAVFFLFYPIQCGISRLMGYWRSKTVTKTDQRVQLMTEILCSIKFIKIYAWEKCFAKALRKIRNKEHDLQQRTAYCQSLCISLAPAVPVISTIITFLAHIIAGNNLTAAQAFSLISYLMQQLYPHIRHSCEIGVKICVGRKTVHKLQSILLLEDIVPYITRPIDKTQAVCISQGSFSWSWPALHTHMTTTGKSAASSLGAKRTQQPATDQEKEKLNPYQTNALQSVNVLTDINFQAAKGHLIGICGHVGSGKTALLLATLGQLRLTSGHVTRDGFCAYVSQEPWIQNATLKDNIVFGECFDGKRYYDAVYRCSLSQDINGLPGGDETEVGERGVNLSGGQKQRLALARALYANRDIYLLDDPLSAVDPQVSFHIFKKCILESLMHKTVILVTNELQYLKLCNQVYMMKDGRACCHGTHDELMDRELEYKTLLNTPSSKREDQAQCITEEAVRVDNVQNANMEDVALDSPDGPLLSGSQDNLENIEKLGPREGQQLTTRELVRSGGIQFNTYQNYIIGAGGYFVAVLVCFIFLLNVGSAAFSSWWLALWIKAGGGTADDHSTGRNYNIEVSTTVNELVTAAVEDVKNASLFIKNQIMPSHNMNDNPVFSKYRLVYVVTIAVILVTSLLRGYVFAKVTLKASSWLHNRLSKRIMYCPMQFFETTPTGRIQNLFSRDMDEVDVWLPITVENFVQNFWIVLFAVLFVCLVFPWFIIPLLILAVCFYFISKIFRVAIRDLKRLENVSRSPIFSWVGATVQGLHTIHAFGKENDFLARFAKMFDENTTCLYLGSIAMRWLAVRIDTLAVTSLCITAFLTVILHGQVPPALAGLALAYAAHISGVFHYTVRLVSETEVRFISVERLNSYYESLEAEGKQKIILIQPPDWPSKGGIKFQNVSLRYRKELPDVLKDISFSIQPGEKLGVVGRTGSGKSSLVVALLRLVELSSGRIKIDSTCVADISLEQLRSKISVIPQDPVLFNGTVRFNLDPFGSYSDEDIWEALIKTQLCSRVSSLSGKLQASIGQGGESFSMGERQLLCLTRALLRKSKVLILDEATASVDPETEVAVQNTVRKEFSNCTILTIAHRLSAVTTCDRILVMKNGQVIELDTPTNLMSNPDSEFSRMLSAVDGVAK